MIAMQIQMFRACVRAVLFSFLSFTSASAAERVVMASLSPGLFEFPIQISTVRGFFRDEGLEIVKVQMQPQVAVMALVAGDVDYSLSWGSALRAAITGVPLRVVAGIAARPLHVLMARPEINPVKISRTKGSASTHLQGRWNTSPAWRPSTMGSILIATSRCS